MYQKKKNVFYGLQTQEFAEWFNLWSDLKSRLQELKQNKGENTSLFKVKMPVYKRHIEWIVEEWQMFPDALL